MSLGVAHVPSPLRNLPVSVPDCGVKPSAFALKTPYVVSGAEMVISLAAVLDTVTESSPLKVTESVPVPLPPASRSSFAPPVAVTALTE